MPSSAQFSGVPTLLQGELGVLGVPGVPGNSHSGESDHSLLDLFLATSISCIMSVNRGSTSFDHRKFRMRGWRSLLRERKRQGWKSLRVCMTSFLTRRMLTLGLIFGLRASLIARTPL